MLRNSLTDWVRRKPSPGLRGFALLAALESAVRGVLISVLPLAIYQTYSDARMVTAIYAAVGVCSLASGLLVPWLTRYVPRRWMYTIGVLMSLLGSTLGMAGGEHGIALAILFTSMATVTITVCFSAYVLDYIAKVELGRAETLRLFYSAISWSAGPFLGVWMYSIAQPLPFMVSAFAALCLLTTFWIMRLGNGKHIARARSAPPNPVAYLARFAAQPRLIAGWTFAMMRSCGWWAYMVYLPIFAVEYSLGEQTAGMALSFTNAMLFLVPFMLRWLQRTSVRTGVRTGFFVAGSCFVLAPLLAGVPQVSLLLLIGGSFFLILLDLCGGLPFLLAVKPSERTEMSAVYSTYRDVANILSPGVAWLVLLVAPIPTVFAAIGGGLLGCWLLAGRLHPRLGQQRIRPPQPLSLALKEVAEQPLRPVHGG